MFHYIFKSKFFYLQFWVRKTLETTCRWPRSHIISSEGKGLWTPFKAEAACAYWLCSCARTQGSLAVSHSKARPSRARWERMLVSLLCTFKAKQVLPTLGLQTFLKSQIPGVQPWFQLWEEGLDTWTLAAALISTPPLWWDSCTKEPGLSWDLQDDRSGPTSRLCDLGQNASPLWANLVFYTARWE